jgi:hypothetical protein
MDHGQDSLASMCSHRLSEALRPAGMVAGWVALSVWVVPYPLSQAKWLPEWTV